jgi:hypothetical protein
MAGEGGGRGMAADGEEEAGGGGRWRQGRVAVVGEDGGEEKEYPSVGVKGCELQNEGGDAGAIGSETMFLCCSF